MRDKIDGRNPDDIINMDQTPVTFSYHSNEMLDIKGTKTIHTIMPTSDTKRITLAATINASGDMLPPYLNFKVSQMDALHHGNSWHSLLRENMHARTRHDGWMKEWCISGLMLFCISGRKCVIWTNHACSCPSWSWMHTACTRWVRLLTESSQWELRWSTSLLGAGTCVSPLMLGLTNLSKLDCMTSGRNGWWKVMGFSTGRRWNHLVKYWPSGWSMSTKNSYCNGEKCTEEEGLWVDLDNFYFNSKYCMFK